MKSIKFLYYLTPILLGIILFSSNFLSTGLFNNELLKFAVWFVLSLFAFSSGWIIDRTLGWNIGGKIIFAVIIADWFISTVIVSVFSGFFGLSGLLTESLILYTLRNVVLGFMGIFGLVVSELFIVQKKLATQQEITNNLEMKLIDADKKANLIIDDAKLKAEKIIFEAEKKTNSLVEKKNKIETQIKEFILLEKEIIKKYESDDK